MNLIVLDASVAAKWFFPEAETPDALRLLSGDFELAAPDLLFVELASVIWKRCRRGEINKSEAVEIMVSVQGIPVGVTETRLLLPRAFDLALSMGRKVYDSVYLALAVEAGIPLVTADLKFVQSIRRSSASFPIRTLQEICH